MTNRVDSLPTRPLKILGLSSIGLWDMGDGKGHASVYRVLQAFVHRGHEMHYAWPRTHWLNPELEITPFQDERTEYAFHEGLHLYRYRHENRFLNSLANLKARWPYVDFFWGYAHFLSVVNAATKLGLELARRIEPDVIYGHNVEGAYAAYWVSRKTGIPNITRLYGSRLYPVLKKPLALFKEIKRVGAYKLPCSYMIMTDDGTHGDLVMKHFGVPDSAVRFWRNGVDDGYSEGVDRQKICAGLNISPSQKIVMMACRLVSWKRVDLLIRAAPQILAAHPETVFVILGEGVEKSNLERLAEGLQVSAQFRFVGAVPRTEVMRYMQCADVFCSLADLSSAANPLLEAMMCACCIVASDTGNVKDLIRQGETGWVFPPGDAQKLAETVIYPLGNPDERQKAARAARQLAKQRFYSWDERASMEIELVEQLCRCSGRTMRCDR